MPGLMDVLDLLYPSAMLWSLSMAMDPIQRYAVSGSYVLAWKTVGAVVELPAFLNSNQRIAPWAGLLALPLFVILATRDSCTGLPPKFRYGNRYKIVRASCRD